MAVVVEERFQSRRSIAGDNPSVELLYVIHGTDDDLEAKIELAAASPATYDGLPRRTIEVEPIANDIWDGTVHYGEIESTFPQTGESAFSFGTGGGTQHLTQSRQTANAYAPAGQTPPDYQGAIGVTDNGVEGVDVVVPVYQFSETHYLADGVVTPAYKGTLFTLTGRVNAAPFKGLAAGECLFLGAAGSKRGVVGDWEISFRFAASPNATGLVVGDITGIAKAGWDYLWVRYAEVEDELAHALVHRPIAAYVERVYDAGDFSLLGIGT